MYYVLNVLNVFFLNVLVVVINLMGVLIILYWIFFFCINCISVNVGQMQRKWFLVKCGCDVIVYMMKFGGRGQSFVIWGEELLYRVVFVCIGVL